MIHSVSLFLSFTHSLTRARIRIRWILFILKRSCMCFVESRSAIYDLQSHFIESYHCMRHALSSCWNELMAMTAMAPHQRIAHHPASAHNNNTNKSAHLIRLCQLLCTFDGKSRSKTITNALFSHFHSMKRKKIATFSDRFSLEILAIVLCYKDLHQIRLFRDYRANDFHPVIWFEPFLFFETSTRNEILSFMLSSTLFHFNFDRYFESVCVEVLHFLFLFLFSGCTVGLTLGFEHWR